MDVRNTTIEEFATEYAGCVFDYIQNEKMYVSGYNKTNILLSHENAHNFLYKENKFSRFVPVVDDEYVKFGTVHRLDYFSFVHVISKYCQPRSSCDKIDNDNMFPHKCPKCNQDAYVGFSNIEHRHGGACL